MSEKLGKGDVIMYGSYKSVKLQKHVMTIAEKGVRGANTNTNQFE